MLSSILSGAALLLVGLFFPTLFLWGGVSLLLLIFFTMSLVLTEDGTWDASWWSVGWLLSIGIWTVYCVVRAARRRRSRTPVFRYDERYSTGPIIEAHAHEGPVQRPTAPRAIEEPQTVRDVRNALVFLGYTKAEANEALRHVDLEEQDPAVMLRAALATSRG